MAATRLAISDDIRIMRPCPLSNSEFVLDFARLLPGANKSKVFARILMTPQNAKALMGTLDGNIKKFETEHGEIKVSPNDPSRAPIGFQQTPPSAPE